MFKTLKQKFEDSNTQTYDAMLEESNLKLAELKDKLAKADYDLKREQNRNRHIKNKFFKAFYLNPEV